MDNSFIKKSQKLILILLVAVFCFTNGAFAQVILINNQNVSTSGFSDDNYDIDKIWEQNGKFEEKVTKIGFNILNRAKVKDRVVFEVSRRTGIINAFAAAANDTVVVYAGMFPYIDNDDELAALIAHEIAHIEQYNMNGLLKPFYWMFRVVLDPALFYYPSRRYEFAADLRGTELMIEAGYNPLAMISLQSKLMGENFMSIVRSHPNGMNRLLNVYYHIEENYPEFLSKDYDNLYYQNFLMTSEEKRAKNHRRRHGLQRILKRNYNQSL